MSNSKYKMFMNYMHNELHITKEDVKHWTQEVVERQAKKAIEGINLIDVVLKAFPKYEIQEIARKTIKQELSSILAEKIEIIVR